MKILTWNVNGLRAVANKGFLDWLAKSKADVIGLQEIKARPEQLPAELQKVKGYEAIFNPADRPGYAGTAIYSKKKPDEVWVGMGDKKFDCEGRITGVRFGDTHIISAYFPNAQPEGARLEFKVEFCRKITKFVAGLVKKKQNIVLTGDYNIAHNEIDLARPDDNHENPGFFPQERQAMTEFLAAGFHDVFREANPGKKDLYTWWSYRTNARDRNIGWRIDYCNVNKGLLSRVKKTWIEPGVMGSDHCPVGIELK